MTKEQETQQNKKAHNLSTKKKAGEQDYIGHRQRLKARFLADLGRSMPDYELLEMLLMYAIPRRDVKPIAKTLINHYINLANVLAANPEELMRISGIGSNAATLFALVHASANKISWENLDNRDIPNLSNTKRIVEHCRSMIGYANQEQLLVIYLDIKGQFIRERIEQVGSVGSVFMSPRDIVEQALLNNACQLIISHNHPSGDCTPSMADIDMTKKLKDICASMDIKLIDHIVISPRQYYSLREHLPFMSIRKIST